MLGLFLLSLCVVVLYVGRLYFEMKEDEDEYNRD